MGENEEKEKLIFYLKLKRVKTKLCALHLFINTTMGTLFKLGRFKY